MEEPTIFKRDYGSCSDSFPKGVLLQDPNISVDANMESNRNLVVVLDGTLNQFGNYNSNCVEFYSHLEKSDAQFTYYNSGIGTYIDPNAYLGPSILWQKLCNAVDMCIAYRLRSYILAAYRWLSDHYRSGDRIFLYGFSRGAYEVRALAAMIRKVGLIHTGNEEQIPFAYDLYADKSSENLASTFKECFSRDIGNIHFVGVWDTVSSVGLFRSRVLPGVQESSHIAIIRHAVSLDERRVKFQPQLYLADGQVGVVACPDLKEVWFAGTHSDVGGGNRQNLELKLGDVPLLWMEWESLKAGIHLKAEAPKIWDFKTLPIQRPIPSLRAIYWLMELWHHGRGRTIPSSHKLHSSLIFKLSERLWRATWKLTPPDDRKDEPKFLPYIPAAIPPINYHWKSLERSVSISSEMVAFFKMDNAELDASLELDLFDSSESQLDYLIAQTANPDCHPSLRSTAFVRLIYIAVQSKAARDRFDERLLEATFDLVEQQNTRLDRAPLHVLWYLATHPTTRRLLLSERYRRRTSNWINSDDVVLTRAGLTLIRELLQGHSSVIRHMRESGFSGSQNLKFDCIWLPQYVIAGIMLRFTNPNPSDPDNIQAHAGQVIWTLWCQKNPRYELFNEGLIEKTFEVASQWTVHQTTNLSMLRNFMEDDLAREHVGPGHYHLIAQLLQTSPPVPNPNQDWIPRGQEIARDLLSCLEQHGLH